MGSEQRLAPIANFPKTGKVEDASTTTVDDDWAWRTVAWIVWTGTVLLTLGLVMLGISIFRRLRTPVNRVRPTGFRGNRLLSEHNPDAIAYVALFGVVSCIIGLIFVGTAAVRSPDYAFLDLWSWSEPAKKTSQTDAETSDDKLQRDRIVDMDWQTKLSAQGTESRIGDGIAAILTKEQNSPLAGIVVFTDGQNNAGLSLESASGQAAAAGVPLYAIGLGSALDPVNARIVDMNAPRRVFPVTQSAFRRPYKHRR